MSTAAPSTAAPPATRPAAGRWHHVPTGGRDDRVDLLRGLAVVLVVLGQLPLPSLLGPLAGRALGPVSGAALLVVLSGAGLGIAARARRATTDGLDAFGRLWGKALRLYATVLVGVLTVYLLTLLPGVDGAGVTSYTDPGTGQTYGLYPNIARLLDYPVPGFLMRDLLLLRLGPQQLSLVALAVVLLVLAPLAVLALRRQLVAALLVLSWLLYAGQALHPVSVLGARFEDPFPVLAWQLLLVHGLVAGWYRDELARRARTVPGRAVVVLVVAVAAAAVVLGGHDPRLATPAGPGQVVATAAVAVTGYAFLTVCGRPVLAALGWLLVPLGRVALPVLVVQVYLALAVANLPGRPYGVLVGTLVHVAVLAVLLLAARHRGRKR